MSWVQSPKRSGGRRRPLLTSREDVACTLAALSDRQRFAFSGKKVKTTTYAVIYARRPHNGLVIKSFQINQTRRAVEDSSLLNSCTNVCVLPQPPRVNLCSSTGPFVGPPATYQLVPNLTHCKTYRRDIEGGGNYSLRPPYLGTFSFPALLVKVPPGRRDREADARFTPPDCLVACGRCFCLFSFLEPCWLNTVFFCFFLISCHKFKVSWARFAKEALDNSFIHNTKPPALCFI